MTNDDYPRRVGKDALEREKKRLEDLKRFNLLDRIEEIQQEIRVEEFEDLAASRMRQLVLSIKKKMDR